MSITGYRDASQALQNLFGDAWEAGPYYLATDPLTPQSVPAFYPNTDEREPTTEPNYVIFSTKSVTAKQISLSAPGYRRYRQTGIVTVEVYIAKSVGAALGELIGDFVSRIFRGTVAGTSSIGGVILRAPRLDYLGAVDDHERYNVVTDFYFDIRG